MYKINLNSNTKFITIKTKIALHIVEYQNTHYTVKPE